MTGLYTAAEGTPPPADHTGDGTPVTLTPHGATRWTNTGATMEDPVRARTDRLIAFTQRVVDDRIRAALIEEGVDPDAVERVARRAQAGEFDVPVHVTFREDA